MAAPSPPLSSPPEVLSEGGTQSWRFFEVFLVGLMHAYQRHREPATSAPGAGGWQHPSNLQHPGVGKGGESLGGSPHQWLPGIYVQSIPYTLHHAFLLLPSIVHLACTFNWVIILSLH